MTGEWVCNSRGLLRWIPPTTGHVRIWSGVNAEARHQCVIDGWNGNPPRPQAPRLLLPARLPNRDRR